MQKLRTKKALLKFLPAEAKLLMSKRKQPFQTLRKQTRHRRNSRKRFVNFSRFCRRNISRSKAVSRVRTKIAIKHGRNISRPFSKSKTRKTAFGNRAATER